MSDLTDLLHSSMCKIFRSDAQINRQNSATKACAQLMGNEEIAKKNTLIATLTQILYD